MQSHSWQNSKSHFVTAHFPYFLGGRDEFLMHEWPINMDGMVKFTILLKMLRRFDLMVMLTKWGLCNSMRVSKHLCVNTMKYISVFLRWWHNCHWHSKRLAADENWKRNTMTDLEQWTRFPQYFKANLQRTNTKFSLLLNFKFTVQ